MPDRMKISDNDLCDIVMEKKIVVLGSFGFGISGLDGQTIKTKNIFAVLQNHCREAYIYKVDTMEMKRSVTALISGIWRVISCSELIILPGQNSFSTLFPLCFYLSKIFRFEIILICIGGWQYEFFMGGDGRKPHKSALRISRKIKCFMPEIHKVNNLLVEQLGFTNTKVLPNFRLSKPLVIRQSDSSGKIEFVFMARVIKEKGYPDIFRAAEICAKNGRDISVTIFGKIGHNEIDDFFKLIESSTNVKYGGEVQPERVLHTLSNYDVLLLPTHFYTEGLPGSILDAYFSGIPVIVSEWKHSHEFVIEGETGYIIPFGDNGPLLASAMMKIDSQREQLRYMKGRALDQSKKYSEEMAWDILKEVI